MTLKVLSVSLSGRTIGNSYSIFINITEEGEFGNKELLFLNAYRSLDCFCN